MKFRIVQRALSAALTSVLFAACLFEHLESGSDTAFDCGPGFSQGNLAVTGVSAADSFLQTTQELIDKCDELGEALEAELSALVDELAITQAMLDEQGSLGLAVRALFAGPLGSELVVSATRADCPLDPRAIFAAAARCEADVGCSLDARAADADFGCLGLCEVSPEDSSTCGEASEAVCSFRGPDLTCSGSCTGDCVFAADSVPDCPGECWGICQGSCSQFGDANLNGVSEIGECIGACRGVCEGTCRARSRVGVACEGTCSGECTRKGAGLDCASAVRASCASDGSGDATCSLGCRGDFTFPASLQGCEASYTCASWAKVTGLIATECASAAVEFAALPNELLTEPAQKQLEFALAVLQERTPRILTAIDRATALAQAGADLATSAGGAEEGMLALLSGRDGVPTETRRRLIECAPAQFEDAGNALASHLNVLNARVVRALGLQSGLIRFP